MRLQILAGVEKLKSAVEIGVGEVGVARVAQPGAELDGMGSVADGGQVLELEAGGVVAVTWVE